MKSLKSKIRDFLNSEEGAVGVKTPLALGVAAGGLMLAQTIVSTSPAQADGYDSCSSDDDCGPGKSGDECVEKGFKVGEEWQESWTWVWDESSSRWLSYKIWVLAPIVEEHMVCD